MTGGDIDGPANTSDPSVAGALAEAASILGSRAVTDFSLGPLTTYKVGGSAALFVTVDDESDLQALAAAVTATGVPTLTIGRGSNLLVSDAGFAGIAFRLGAGFEQWALTLGSAQVTAGGALSLPVLARTTVSQGLTGFEWAVGVPGSVGGAVAMNAGGHGSDMAASLVRVRVVDLRSGEDVAMPVSVLDLSYRHSALTPTQVVTSADLQLRPGPVEAGEAELAAIVRWRRANQPGGQNAGSVFTNPPGDSAGRLIDLVGAKGLRLGSAQVSTKHANFIQADPDGSADDVHDLMVEVHRRVQDQTGIDLVAETRLIGFR